MLRIAVSNGRIAGAALLAAIAGMVALGASPATGIAGAATYRTPGYRGVRRAPRTVPARPPAPLVLTQSGERPQVLVDAAGTAHVTWNERGEGDAPDTLRYCRVRRGGRGCEVEQRLVPEQPYDGGNAPGFNDDVGVPRVLGLNDQLVLLTNRYPNTFPGPDGEYHASNTYLFASDDGGATFGPPALVGTGQTSGQPGVFGSGDALRIGLVSDTQTGGTFFQQILPGRYSPATVNLGGDGIDSAVAAIDGRPAVAFASIGAQTTVRVWSGQGDIQDPGTWTTSPPFAGDSPRLADGPAGLFLITRAFTGNRALSVRRVSADGRLGAPATIPRSAGAALADLTQDASGRLIASYRQSVGAQDELLMRTSADGRTWTAPEVLRRVAPTAGIWDADLSAAADGGGFSVVWESSSGQPGPILALPFGNRGPTSRAGLGGLAGGSLPPGVVETCQQISFGAVRVKSGGCLLSAAGQPGVKVSEGLLRLNGLEVVPEGSARIMIDSRRGTIDSTGDVRVQLRADGIEPIVLFRGKLHIDTREEARRPGSSKPPACPGRQLASFEAGGKALKGFPIKGSIEVYLLPESSCIPLALALPKAFGGVSGEAVLRADNARGLILDSLKVGVERALIGPVLIEGVLVSYRAGSDEWFGAATVGLPPQPGGAKVGADVLFQGGEFRRGNLILRLPFPGLALDPFAVSYLKSLQGGFGIDPLTISVGAGVGILPTAPPVYTFEVDGRLTVTFRDPVEFRFDGQGRMMSFPIADTQLIVRTDGFASTRANLRLDVEAVSVEGALRAFVDLRSETFGGNVDGKVCIVGVCPARGEAVVSSRGIGACVTQLATYGFGYLWGAALTDVDIMFGSCDLSDYTVAAPAGAARAAQSGAVTVAAGAPVLSLRLTGEGGAPDVTLVAPDGRRIVPTGDLAAAEAAGAVAGRVEERQLTYVAVPRPAAGTWRVEANPGTPALREVASARPLPAPKVSGRVGGRARARRLTYRVTTGNGLATQFVERWGGGEARIGAARGARGTLRFTPAPGPRGRREIVAVVTRDGAPRLRRTIATYVAPAPSRPARVRGLRVVHRGGAVVARWRGVPGARSYVVRIDLADGRRLLRLLGPRARGVRVAGVARRERAVVRVTARDAAARSGPVARARG